MVHRKEGFGASLFRHLPGLFGRTVVMHPRIVSPYRHDGQVVWTRTAQAAEGIGESRVSSEDYAVAVSFNRVTVEAAPRIGADARSPVVHGEGANFEATHARALAPRQFLHAAVLLHAEQVAGFGGGDDRRAAALQMPQAADIEVIHVGVGKQNYVDLRQFSEAEGRFDDALQPDRNRAQANTHPPSEHGVGEHGCPIDLEQHSAVPQPGRKQARSLPRSQIGPVRGGKHTTALPGAQSLPVHRSYPASPGRPAQIVSMHLLYMMPCRAARLPCPFLREPASLGVTWIRAPGFASSSIHREPSGASSTSRMR